jgi:hypothetical protein
MGCDVYMCIVRGELIDFIKKICFFFYVYLYVYKINTWYIDL